MAKKSATIDLYDLSSRFKSGDTTIINNKDKNAEDTDNRLRVSLRAEIVSDNVNIEPDGFSEISFRNIGQCTAKILDVIPLDISDPEIVLGTPLYARIIDKIRITFTGASTDKQVVVIKKYYSLP